MWLCGWGYTGCHTVWWSVIGTSCEVFTFAVCLSTANQLWDQPITARRFTQISPRTCQQLHLNDNAVCLVPSTQFQCRWYALLLCQCFCSKLVCAIHSLTSVLQNMKGRESCLWSQTAFLVLVLSSYIHSPENSNFISVWQLWPTLCGLFFLQFNTQCVYMHTIQHEHMCNLSCMHYYVRQRVYACNVSHVGHAEYQCVDVWETCTPCVWVSMMMSSCAQASHSVVSLRQNILCVQTFG